MLNFVNLAAVGLLAGVLGQTPATLEPVPLVSWQEAKIFDLPTQPDAAVAAIVEDYLNRLAAAGFDRQQQGVWIQSEWAYLAQYRQAVPASAASLTKIATTLAALEQWGTDHRFETRLYTLGSVENGVLRGDLVVEGGGDPLFVWEEAIALGNALNKLGIRQVTGNLIITGNFYLNFKTDPLISGELLKQGLDEGKWAPAVEKQYQALPPGTPRPQVVIAGSVRFENATPPDSRLLLRHQSLTLTELLKQMNIYSNNAMAEMLAHGVGGAAVVAQVAAVAADIPPAEIQFVNGSGLSVDNRLSPRAVANLFIALERKLAGSAVKVADLFPVAGRDTKGTMHWRSIPAGIAVKTGTLAQVSALAGVIPTQERGAVWFTIINHGGNIEKFRAEQDKLVQRLAQHWQLLPVAIGTQATDKVYLGDPSRNLNGE
jgi:D-alanyl-D-alanine carboxypeptidase/D-alanyl-D-alanine-endopeptidase (penicillin-binding protein 4)